MHSASGEFLSGTRDLTFSFIQKSGNLLGMQELEKKISSILERAGEILLSSEKNWLRDKPYQGPVTSGDVEVEEFMKGELRKILPAAGFLGEEGGEEGEKELRWVLDPVDGTVNYLHSLPHFAISLSLEEKGMPVMGFVYDVWRKELFFARKGEGAFLNGKRIKVSGERELSRSLISTGFPRLPELRERNLRIFCGLLPLVQSLRRLGSASLDLAYVACGRLEGFWEIGLNRWDISAGVLLVKEAGGEVTDFEGETGFLEKRELLATNGKLHGELLSHIQRILSSP